MSNSSQGKELPNCRRCRHYFVTWVPSKPHGCRAMAFRSAIEPSLVVFQSSGLPCRLYQRKPPRD